LDEGIMTNEQNEKIGQKKPDIADVMQVIHRYVPKNFSPRIGIILGSGLSSLAEQLTSPVSIPYSAIPGLQQSGTGVAGHASLLMMGHLNNIPIVCLRGRLHLYEGTPYHSIQTLIHILKHLGCTHLLLTCAAGAIQANVKPGELMLITDHINFQPGNPLAGPNDESTGPRFVGMEDAYDPILNELIEDTAKELGITLHQGVYLATLGPSFETPAEIRAFKAWGADAVGMSVVPEVIFARHCGLKVVCIAAITNEAAGLSKEKITHEGTLKFGEAASRHLIKLVPTFLNKFNETIG
jgi:xanthosine phosphorylase